MIRQALSRIFVVLLFLCPVLVLVSVRFFGTANTSLILIFVFLCRLALGRSLNKTPMARVMNFVLWISLFMNLLNLYFKNDSLLKMYPVLMSSGFAALFIRSLAVKRPLIEDFARILDKSLSAEKIRYTFHLTIIWSIWLSVNSILAFYTAVASSFDIWALYNNLIFYIVCGVLFFMDICYRMLFREKLKGADSGV